MARRHPLQDALAPLLAPLSLLYGRAALARRRLTRRGLFSVWTPPRPCVSVGNISWGGTGKTPVTDWILTEAARRGLTAVVLTRGYGSRPPVLPLRVTPDLPAAHAGDEPLMLARRHPDALVLVDPDRARAGRAAQATAAPDLFVLDDGFQHLSVGRHLNLVLLDADDVRRVPPPGGVPSNWNRVLPRGTWREPAAALIDADAFLIKTSPDEWPALTDDLARRLAPFRRPVFAFRLRPEGLRPCSSGRPEVAEAEITGPYALITGVGNPDQVRRTVEEYMDASPVKHLIYPDHADFTARGRDVTAAVDALRGEFGPLNLICTAKDAVKLDGLPRLYSLDVTADFFAALPANDTDDKTAGFSDWFGTWLESRLMKQ